ncbi:DUF4360 domain-containing protein [Spartinivicinus ruber]|uniref:DUF4360 domain-containing protein n=1 Tax=Spartinivicinus ruber TaxID=2683272 RepID=UPI0013D75D32|nr:DUF4360 domain-containing protein [Spartinivicinus ruber]
MEKKYLARLFGASICAIALLPMVSVSANPTIALEDPPENSVYIEDIVYGGTGCPNGTVGTSIAPSGLNFGVSFDQYIAGIGEDYTRADKRKYCELRINLHVPSGYSYAIADIIYRGYAELDKGIVGTLKSRYRFQGELLEAGFAKTIRGQVDKDFAYEDTLDLESYVWSDCGATAPVVLNTQIRLNSTPVAAPNAGGTIGVDSVEGKLTQEYGLVWRRCGELSNTFE